MNSELKAAIAEAADLMVKLAQRDGHHVVRNTTLWMKSRANDNLYPTKAKVAVFCKEDGSVRYVSAVSGATIQLRDGEFVCAADAVVILDRHRKALRSLLRKKVAELAKKDVPLGDDPRYRQLSEQLEHHTKMSQKARRQIGAY